MKKRTPNVEHQISDILAADGRLHRVIATPTGEVLCDLGIVVNGKVV